jgi:hypothetical protein
VIKPFLLRREKKDVLADQGAAAPSTSAAGGSSSAVQPKHLPRKNDMVVWLRMKPLQVPPSRTFTCPRPTAWAPCRCVTAHMRSR